MSAAFTSPSRQLTSFTERQTEKVDEDSRTASYSCTLICCTAVVTVSQLLSTIPFSTEHLICLVSPFQHDMASKTDVTVFVSFHLSESVHISILQARVIGVFMMAAIVAPSL